ncbi:hypothetical protein [Stieleria varia]|uniref:Uncharacterized protein n=1 Tax=Stieleria varia TaxID=2528005 RepID=A0A5C6B697_9BACT|nr:hypothetical protein [Stieleria varia]TWU07815.1 hypothetical protein Pla52n_03900 [Stieleria varia]
MSEPLLKIPNHHAATCGDPPIINGEESHLYIGYFENKHGEQWIFTRDRKTGIATLRGGDIGWNTPIALTDCTNGTLTLNPSEAQWLESCLAASQAFARR